MLTVSLFDDDTGSPIDMSGVTLALPMMPFTGTNWTVTDGSITTTSTTRLTIPVYPIGSQNQALALTVGTGLGILPGDPIAIVDQNPANSFHGYVTSYASGTGALVCQIGCTYQFEIRQIRPHDQNRDGYGIWYDFGIYPDYGPILTATLGGVNVPGSITPLAPQGTIFITDIGKVQVRIPELSTKILKERTYYASMTFTDGFDTRQIFRAQLPSQYGGVSI